MLYMHGHTGIENYTCLCVPLCPSYIHMLNLEAQIEQFTHSQTRRLTLVKLQISLSLRNDVC